MKELYPPPKPPSVELKSLGSGVKDLAMDLMNTHMSSICASGISLKPTMSRN